MQFTEKHKTKKLHRKRIRSKKHLQKPTDAKSIDLVYLLAFLTICKLTEQYK